jgi:hypothetical protein
MPWHTAALWAAIIVFGLYALLLLLAIVFPRGWGRWRMKHAKRPAKVQGVHPELRSELPSSENNEVRLSANGKLKK